MADLKRTRRVIFNESDFSITNSPISAFCHTYCQGICNAFNREFGTNYTPEQLSAQSATQQIWGFPLFNYDGNVSDNYYFAISGSGNNNKLGMAIYLKENDATISDLVQPAVNLYTGSSSYLNLPFYSNNYSYTAKIYNGFLIFSPIPNGYSFGGLCYTGTDSSVKEDIQNNGVPAETFLFQKVSDYSENTYTGILKFESASNTGINALSYVVDGLFKTKKIIPYEIQAQLSSAYRDETIACRIMDKFVKFDVYICSLKNSYGNIKDFYTISNHVGSNNPLVNIYNKDNNKYVTTLPTVTRSEKWAMLLKGFIQQPPKKSEWLDLISLPLYNYRYYIVVGNSEKIHIFATTGSGQNITYTYYVYDGELHNLPQITMNEIRSAVLCGNDLYVLYWSYIDGCYKFCKLNNIENSISLPLIYETPKLLTYKNEVYCLFYHNSATSLTYFYKYNGNEFELVSTDFPELPSHSFSSYTEYNGSLYVSNTKKIYKYDGNEWTIFPEPPDSASRTYIDSIIAYNGYLHYFWVSSSNSIFHYIYYDDEWHQLLDNANGIYPRGSPVIASTMFTTVFNDKITTYGCRPNDGLDYLAYLK